MKTFRLLLLLSAPLVAQDTLTLLFAGDAMLHQQQLEQTFSDGTYRFDGYFDALAEEIQAADIAFVNLETTLGTPPYTGYPAFSSPPAFAIALREAGFDQFLLANNHSLDRGANGVRRTLQVLDSLAISHTGLFRDTLHRAQTYPRLIRKNDFRLLLLNYTYETNGIRVAPPLQINYMDTLQMRADLEEAKRFNPDFILVQLHWGNEYQTESSREQQKMAAWLFEQGVDLLIGHHPHVLQPMELVVDSLGQGRHLVVYSLGNFVSNMSQPRTRTGAMVRVQLCRSGLKRYIASAAYELVFVDRYRNKQQKEAIRIVPARSWEAEYKSTSLLSDSVWINEYKMAQTLLDKANQNLFPEIFFEKNVPKVCR